MKNELLKTLLTLFSGETLYAENGLALRYRLFTGKGENLPLVLFLHGMSQRGGSVVTYVKYGQRIHSPIVDLGEADYILSFEALEAARWLPYLKKDGLLITNSAEIWPMPVITGAAAYPEDIPEKLRARANVLSLDAMALAQKAGSPKAVNLVLLGVLSQRADWPESVWQEAIEHTVPAKFLEMNKKAFALGRAAWKEA